MVKGINFSNIHIICGNHGNDHSIEMIFREGAAGMSAFYSCPKYISELKRENDIEGRSCFNRLGTTDFMKMMDIISNEKFTDDGQLQALKGFKFSIKQTDFKVIEEKGDELWVMVLNKKAAN